MTVTTFVYGKAQQSLAHKEIDWHDGAVYVALCTATYTPDQDAHDYFDDITNEVTGDGYTAGGEALGSPTFTYTAGTNVMKLDGADTTWTAATVTFQYAIIYYSTGTASTSPLIAYVDFGESVVVAGVNLTITWAAAGIVTLTAA